MNISEVSLLLNAGFTRDEILKMIDYPIPADPAPADPAPAGGTTETLQELIKTVNNLSNVVKEMQNSNARKATGGKATKKTSADVITDFFGSP